MRQFGFRFLRWFQTSAVAGQLFTVASVLPATTFSLLATRTVTGYEWIPDDKRLYIPLVVASLLYMASHICLSFWYRRRYRSIQLYYFAGSGVLEDERLREQNVALRRDTVDRLIAAVLADPPAGATRTAVVEKLASEIGVTFATRFSERAPRDEWGKWDDSPRELLKRLLEYDSQAGMGNLWLKHLDEQGPQKVVLVTARNPISRDPLKPNDLTPFLPAYLAGLCGYVFGGIPFTTTWARDQGRLNSFTITLKG